MIRVLLVEHVPSLREQLVSILESDARLQVLPERSAVADLPDTIRRHRPDVIVMSIDMPGTDPFAATRRVMEAAPRPIVLVSSNADDRTVETTVQAMEAGALALVARPPDRGQTGHDEAAGTLIETVRLMAEVRVVRRWPRRPAVAQEPAQEPAPQPRPLILPADTGAESRLVAIGASTGGPPVLHTILSQLTMPFPLPILIVQHIAAGFSSSLAEWLNNVTERPVRLASDGEIAQPGVVYIAPDGLQMGVRSGGRITISRDSAEYGLCPSISYLFRSLAYHSGPRAIGLLLTGMGKDGAEELRLMKDQGAITIVQDKESSAVHGMAGEAIKLGAAKYVLKPDEIATMLNYLTQQRKP